MRIDLKDQKIIHHLYHNARMPSSELAKKCSLSREQANYRITKLRENGIIRKIFPILNYRAIGYRIYIIIFVKFYNSGNEESFIRSRNVLSWGKAYSEYDLYANLVFKDEDELNTYLFNMIKSPQYGIKRYEIIRPHVSELYPLKFLGIREKDGIDFIRKDEEISIDEKDRRILKRLSEDARARIIDIAKSANISSELAMYRMKRLKKVIIGSRIQFDMEKLGYYFCLIRIQLQKINENSISKLRQFCKTHRNINSFIVSSTEPLILIQVFHREEKELRDSIKGIKDLFQRDSYDISLTPIDQESEEINPVPFF